MKKSKKYLKSYIFWFIQKQSLAIDYQISVINYTKLLCERMWLFTFEFGFQRSKALVIDYQNIVIDYIFFEINWNVVNSFENFFQKHFATCNRLQQSGNRLPESKNSLVNMFWKKSMCYSVFEKTFSYLSWLSLLLIFESWVLNLEPWILILGNLNLESWFLILEIKFPLEPWSVLDSILIILNILNSFFDYHELTFELFVITFVIIKTILNQSWFFMKLCFYKKQVGELLAQEKSDTTQTHFLF